MASSTEIISHAGERWRVQRRESQNLSTAGGYLVASGGRGIITLSLSLSAADQERAYEALLCRVVAIPAGKSGAALWHPHKE